ncbi:MAG: helix-turn-helix domain-containing protein, partial [Chloroflexi bacterium]|nr:helix-turn-helix domain-containing protein [Chloroflexota bacterium]
MLRISDVALLLGLHPNTVRLWSNRGMLKSYRIGSRGDRRFRWEDVDNLLKEGEREKLLSLPVPGADEVMGLR